MAYLAIWMEMQQMSLLNCDGMMIPDSSSDSEIHDDEYIDLYVRMW